MGCSGWYVNTFWTLREYISDTDDAITPGLVRDLSEMTGVVLDPDDYDIIIAMDREYRIGMREVQRHIHEARMKKNGAK